MGGALHSWAAERQQRGENEQQNTVDRFAAAAAKRGPGVLDIDAACAIAPASPWQRVPRMSGNSAWLHCTSPHDCKVYK